MPTKGTAYYNGPDRNKDLEAYALRAPYPGKWLPSPYFCLVGIVTGLEVGLVATSTSSVTDAAYRYEHCVRSLSLSK